MREGWNALPLARVCSLFTDGDWIETKDQSPEGIRLIQTGNVGLGEFKDRENKARFISEATFKRLNCEEVHEGDCLVSRLPDPVGRSCIVPAIDAKMITAVDCTILRFREDKLSPEFFNYYSQSVQYLIDVEAYCTGATRKRISRKNLGKVHIPVPPLPEQKRIVAILDEAFAGIATAVANTEKNLANARELFESYLNAVFSQRGDGWREDHLEDLCTGIFAGGDVPKANHSKQPTERYRIPIFTNGEKNNGLYGYTDSARVTRPSLTISARGTIGFTQIRSEPYYPAIRLIVAIPDQAKLNLPFLYYAIRRMTIGHSGTSIPQLTAPMVRAFSIGYPSPSEQKEIVERLNSLLSETKDIESIYKQKLNALAELRQSLLQKAFSGELTAAPQDEIETALA